MSTMASNHFKYDYLSCCFQNGKQICGNTNKILITYPWFKIDNVVRSYVELLALN